MLSIVIPTMWRYEPFVDFLENIVKVEAVDEVVIINNDISRTPANPVLAHPKVTLISCDRNIFVNPAWNLGVKISRNEKICIINDDVVVDLKLFYKLDQFISEDIGTVGVVSGDVNLGQPPLVDGTIEFVPWTGQLMYGFGNLFCVHKNNWVDIPEDLKIYYGDNWVFDTQLFYRQKTNYMIANLFFHHAASTTTMQLETIITPDSDLNLDNERTIYNQELNKLLGRNQPPATTPDLVANILEKEYEKFSDPYYRDFYLHMPVLRNLAKECGQVTEFGIAEGQSTRALLVEPVTLRSYDLKLYTSVQQLFELARSMGKDAYCFNADTLTLDIDETDLLFIDTWHVYPQLKQELTRHHSRVRKYIAMHDTHTFGTSGETDKPDVGLLPAILEFLAETPGWRVKSHSTVCNGLTVLERVAA